MGSLEEELLNALKYTNFTGGSNPIKLIQGLLKSVELTMLNKMAAQINARISELKGDDYTPELDPFEILGVDEDSTKEEVTKAYKEKAHAAHPDVGGSHEEMTKVNAAFEAIKLFKGWK